MAPKPDAILNFDGACKNNPGPAAAGAVLKSVDGTILCESKRYLGHATSNVAEYSALILGLESALERGVRRIEVRGDSELVVKQLLGDYKVRDAKLKRLNLIARELISKFDSFSISHVPREQNAEADKLANEAID